jgi:hypothetical protein
VTGSAPGEERPQLVPAVVTDLPPVPAATTGVVTVSTPGDVVVEIADVGAVPASWLRDLVIGLARPAR